MFFGLNLIFNGVMWTLFTKALARGTSTTQVSIINTSSNFMITAVLGFFIFTESLPPLWWVGAAMLVAGNVIIGRREEKEIEARPDSQGAAENGESNYSGSDSDGEVILPEEGQLEDALKSRDEEDLLDLNADAVESPTAERSTRSRK
jgi:multidrug transporter EmrE-like cation transporter